MKFPNLKVNIPWKSIYPDNSTNPNQRVYNLFVYCIKVVASFYKGKDVEYKNHNQWANFLFHHDTSSANRISKMSSVKRDYGIYFEGGKTYTFDVDKIVRDFPKLFQLKDTPPPIPIDIEELKWLLDFKNDVEKEIKQAQNPKHKEKYRVIDLEIKDLPNRKKIYVVDFENKEQNEIHLKEGTPINLKIGKYIYPCDIIDADFIDNRVYLSCNMDINWDRYYNAYLEVDLIFILQELKRRLTDIIQNIDIKELRDRPIGKILIKDLSVKGVSNSNIEKQFYEQLDETQRKAFCGAINKDITLIWGPPGTGKSYTLASIIRGLYAQKHQRTLVCCISNVAVDQLVNKVIYLINKEGLEMRPGEFYRAGYTNDDIILATDYLFPNDNLSERLRCDIKNNKLALKEFIERNGKGNSDVELLYKLNIENAQNRLKEHTEKLINSSKVIFSTISNFILSARLQDMTFDNLIVDETSMVSMPYLMAIAFKISKRVILVGDFKQLNPISLIPNSIMKKNVFDYCNVDLNSSQIQCLYQLTFNRRSNSQIVNLINTVFYNDKLNCIESEVPNFVKMSPYEDKIIVVQNVNNNESRFTRGGTRQNEFSAKVIIDILDEYYSKGDFSFSIGIITPYKGQVALLKALLRERNYDNKFLSKIKIGTIHTFQGSECDLILFDIVEARNNGIGKLYSGQEGEQLINVAISRAKHKLIIVGDVNLFTIGAGNAMVSNKVTRIFRTLSYLLN